MTGYLKTRRRKITRTGNTLYGGHKDNDDDGDDDDDDSCGADKDGNEFLEQPAKE